MLGHLGRPLRTASTLTISCLPGSAFENSDTYNYDMADGAVPQGGLVRTLKSGLLKDRTRLDTVLLITVAACIHATRHPR